MSLDIPVIDFYPFLNGTDEDREKVSLEIGKACRNVGFFYLSNHDIPSSLIERVYQQAEHFFSQSIEEKMKLYIGSCRYGNNRGYTPMFEEKLSPKGDLKEGFDLAMELPADDKDRIERGAILYGPNFWPDNLHGFRECIYNEFYLKMLSLGEKLFEAFALSLNLPSNYFKSMCQKPMVTMRLLHYPPQTIIQDEDQLGCGAHTDYECFTLLSQSNQSGLQILNNTQEWINAKPMPNTFVVNIGDLMQRWTNDQFKSTIHRVINTSGTIRYSIPVFFGPNYFTKIKSLINDEKEKYEPILADEYLTQRFNDTYQYRQTNSSST
ncbi:unnamed protein product [Rotaria magnacalcarata]|uniref:Fe2OG dioxygenase domain-containing protein n=2 Tax=Rotaria magnacalcarata TaxID=392030 RepID=A0A819DCY0_9BILA|nr:unnamed protein product [Rotaria magnacalcarata]CAF2106413.1 unnamed protein product [Rotaria magnacalcarata]CAF3827009.1 unnamed protein product [Rotaria magnacalcarata]CAF3865520.1 unnamed protein product [Rotaria magnacalcarata]